MTTSPEHLNHNFRDQVFTLCFWIFLLGAGSIAQTLSAAPKYVQSASAAPQTPQRTVTVPFPGAQAVGDLNVAIVGWNDTASVVSSVTDRVGNKYKLAVGPTVFDGLSQSIYYSNKIAPGVNSVTVTFSQAAAYPDIRVLEYRGIDPANPIDLVKFNAGTGGTSSSGSGTTTSANDLLVAGNIVQQSTIAAGTNFKARQLTIPDGDIAEDQVVTAAGSYNATASLSGAGGWVMQMVAFRAAPIQKDTTPPTVAITAPTGGATVTGTINVTVNASDTQSGVAGIRLFIDGLTWGTGAVTSPINFSVKTAQFANGTHTLVAQAWDAANNYANSSPVTVTFNNSTPGNPGQLGVWSNVISMPVVAVHTALLPNGKIFMSDGQGYGAVAIDWNYVVNTYDFVNAPVNIFCHGMDLMADGRLMIVGGHESGHVGLTFAGIFDPSSEAWTVLPRMAYPRWYPTLSALSDGRLIVTSGEMNGSSTDQPIPEIYTPSTNSWSQLSNAPIPFIPAPYYYPHTMQLPDGRLLIPSDTEIAIVSQVLSSNLRTWSSVGGPAVDGGSTAQYLPGKILKTGTANDTDNDAAGKTRTSANTAYILDMTQTTPVWSQVASMRFGRTYHCTTVLPDGNVLVTGGGSTTYPTTNFSTPVLAPELWSPTTKKWTTLGSMSTPRLYHGVALLLPDGRVMVSGGGRWPASDQPTDKFSAEFFAPPYLFKGARPVITSAPSTLIYGQNFTVQTQNAAQIASASLIRFAADTHDFNTQYFVPLSFSVGFNSLTITGAKQGSTTVPLNSNLAPPGYYMLFIVATSGAPSMAAIVHL